MTISRCIVPIAHQSGSTDPSSNDRSTDRPIGHLSQSESTIAYQSPQSTDRPIARSAIYTLNRNRGSLINLLDQGSSFFNSCVFFPIVSNEMRWAIRRVVRVPMDFNRSTFETFLLDQTRLHIEGRWDRRRLLHHQSFPIKATKPRGVLFIKT